MITWNQLLASAIILALMGFNFPAIPKLFRELVFYSKCGWKFTEDSGTSFWLQDQLVDRYSFLPIGVIKLMVLSTQVWFFCAPLIAAWNGYLARQ